jgi:hypothetical protein
LGCWDSIAQSIGLQLSKTGEKHERTSEVSNRQKDSTGDHAFGPYL